MLIVCDWFAIILGKFVLNTVILYHYTLYIIQGIIFAAPGFWILEYQLVLLACIKLATRSNDL